MKLVTAIIQPQQLPAVKRAIAAGGFADMTCTNVLGTVPNAEERQTFRGVEHEITLFQKVRIEIAVNDERLDALVEALCQGCKQSGGSGKVMVTSLHDFITAATGKRGPDEL